MRPEFQLGSLYDRRTDNLLSRYALWKEDNIKKKGFFSQRICSSQQWLTDSENTFSSKVRNLDIESGLTLSLLGEMINIKGHAKYFEDTVSSSNVAKVSLTYKETTVYQELTLDALYDIDYQDPLARDEQEVAFTHVVVGIQYGGMCTMVFERGVKESETKEEIERELSAALKAIPISTDDNFDLNSDGNEKLDNFRCTVYSDFISNTRIANWNEARALYKSFPAIISISRDFSKDRGVPVKIWLLPKACFGSQNHIVIKEISSSFVNKSKELIESLTRAVNESRDLLNKTKKYHIVNEKLARFLKAVEDYKSAFHKCILSPLVYSIRSGSEKEDLLSDAFQKHQSSPFAYLALWLRKIKEEVDTFLLIEKQLSEVGVSFVREDFLQSIAKKTISVVLTLKVSKREDLFINEMENYNSAQTETAIGVEDFLNKKLWFEDEPCKEEILRMAYEMRNVAYANQINENVGFFMREVECDTTPECHVEAWENGQRLALELFEVITDVHNFSVEKYSHNTLEIKWNVAQERKSSISAYKIEVNCLSDGDETQSLELLSQTRISPSTECIMAHEVKNLRPGNTYKISLQCLWLNDNLASKPVELFQMTRFSNPPVNIKAKVTEKRHIKLSWGNPTILAKGSICKSFLIEYKNTSEEIWQNRLVEADLQTYIFSDVNYDAEYIFRMLACYESGEETLPTEEIHVKTEPLEIIQIDKVHIHLYMYICKYLFSFRVFSGV